MATEEPTSPGSPDPAAPPPAGASQLNYPEMIMSAIESLNDKNGSNKSAISRYIEANYGELPGTHSTLLAHYLNKMKVSGEIVLLKNNYMKPDPNAPPKRGRGRPPKPKDLLAAPTSVAATSPRPRGRPPKAKDLQGPPPLPKAPAPSVSGRKRGRPPKNAKPAAAAAAPPPPPAAAAASDGPVVKRGRGRPPKVKPAVAPVGA